MPTGEMTHAGSACSHPANGKAVALGTSGITSKSPPTPAAWRIHRNAQSKLFPRRFLQQPGGEPRSAARICE
jgi:hypothetical protein